MRTRLMARLAAAALAVSALPSAAFAAGDEDQARAATAAAKAKIETGAKLGMEGEAADVQARARTALEAAQAAVRDDNEDRAYHAAREADALAELAIVTAELKKLQDERNQLAAR